MFDVVALGELLIDFTSQSTASSGYPILAAHPGGAPCNLLATLAKFGASTAFLGKVGDDSFGHLLCSTLSNAGVDTSGLVFDHNCFTTLAFVTLTEDGDRSFSFARKPGADTMLSADEVSLSLIAQSRVFHFGSLSLTHEPARAATRHAVNYAKAAGKLISYDPNLRISLWNDPAEAKTQILWGLSQADIVKISDDEAAFLFDLDAEAGAHRIMDEYGAKLVFVTCGADGCCFCNQTASGRTSAPKDIQVIDTTGAGDIFAGAALWTLLQYNKTPEALGRHELEDITRFACTAATLSTAKFGGISSVPDLDNVYRLMKHADS